MKHPDWKETKVQRRMVRRIATDLAMEELYMQKKLSLAWSTKVLRLSFLIF